MLSFGKSLISDRYLNFARNPSFSDILPGNSSPQWRVASAENSPIEKFFHRKFVLENVS